MKVPETVRSAISAVIEGCSAHSLETDKLDFKQPDRDLRKLLDDLAAGAMCFANASGGFLVVGVANRPGGPGALKGCTADLDTIRKGIFDRTSPGLLVGIEVYSVPEAPAVRLVVVEVLQGTEVYSVAGRVTVRMGTDCQALSPAEVHRLYSARLSLDLTAEATPFGQRDISSTAMEIVRRRLRAMPEGGREIAELPLNELLRNLQLLDDSGALRRAGALLLVAPAEGSDASLVYVHRPRASAEPDFSFRLSGSVLEVAERAIDLVRARRHDRNVLLPSGQQITVADFPELAIREAIANALVHRDYRLAGSVFIEHDDEQITVVSPGGFVAGVTAENLLTGEPRARNPLLAEAARNLRLGELLGVGVDRMYRSMIAAGGDPPTFEGRDESVKVRFGAARNLDVAKFVAQLPTRLNDEHETDVLIVLHELCRKRTINAEALMPAAQRRLEESQLVLQRMASVPLELLEPTRRTASSQYPVYRLRDRALAQLGTAVRYHRRSGDDIDRKVLAHVEEYERVTNATVRNLLDVGVTRASAILRDMVVRGLLLKTSMQQRGSAVEYGPGPEFPAAIGSRVPPKRRVQTPRRRGSDISTEGPRLFD